MEYPVAVTCFVIYILSTVVGQVDPGPSHPYFSQTVTNLTYSVGDTATLKCGVRNRGSKTISWRRVQDAAPLTIGTYTYTKDIRFSSTHNKFKHEWNLHIDTVKMKDMGVYECQVSTKDNMVQHFTLSVIERQIRDVPKKGVVVTGTDIIEVGQPLSLTCNATGKTEVPHDVEWFKGSERVISNSRTMVEISKYKVAAERSFISYLVVERSRIEDSGAYLCRSSDKETDIFNVLVLNERTFKKQRHNRKAATYNVKRGTEKNAKGDNPSNGDNGHNRGSVKKQLKSDDGTHNGYYTVQKPSDDSESSDQSRQLSDRGSGVHLSPLTFHTFVLVSFLTLLLNC